MRCVLEGFTYLCTVNKKKLLEAYLAATNGSKNEGENLENLEVESPENSPENNGENDTF